MTPANKPSSRLKTALGGTVMQLLILVVLVLGISWINSSSEVLLNHLIGSTASRWLFASIGTPVHELSHAVIALLFGFRITEFRPFILDPSSSTLGYVRYSYDPTNLLQQIGHFFVGIAPVFVPLIIIYLLYRLLIPKEALEGQPTKLFRPQTVLFLYVVAQIVLHMRCSPADLSGAAMGLPFLIGILFLIGLISDKAQRYMLAGSTFLTFFALALAVIDHIILRVIWMLAT